MDYEAAVTTLGLKIKSLRLAKGYSMERLAFVANLSKESVRRIELGQKDLRLSTICKLSEALGVTLAALLTQAETRHFKKNLPSAFDEGL